MPTSHPASLSLLTGKAVPVPPNFRSEAFGKHAAHCANKLHMQTLHFKQRTNPNTKRNRDAQEVYTAAQAFAYRCVGSRTLTLTLDAVRSHRAAEKLVVKQMKLGNGFVGRIKLGLVKRGKGVKRKRVEGLGLSGGRGFDGVTGEPTGWAEDDGEGRW